MTKREFLDEVKKEMGFLSVETIAEAERYFESFFTGSESDADVISRLGSPKQAAQRYCRNNIFKDDVSPEPQRRVPQTRQHSGSILLAVVILVLLSPILVPLAITCAVFIMCVAVFLVGLYLVLLFGGVICWFAGASVIINGLFSGLGFVNILLQCGIGCAMFGFGLLVSWLVIMGTVKFGTWLIRKIVDSGSKTVRGGNAK